MTGRSGDRRRPGVQNVIIENDVGDVTGAFQIQGTVSKTKAYVGVIGGILAIFVIVAQAAQCGVQKQIRDEIGVQLKPPNGTIYKSMESCAHEHTEELAEKVAEEIDQVENGVIRLETRQEAIRERQEQQHEEQMRILREIRTNGSN